MQQPRTPAQRSLSVPTTGSTTVNRAPAPGVDSTSTRPSCCSTISRLIASPSPAQPIDLLVAVADRRGQGPVGQLGGLSADPAATNAHQAVTMSKPGRLLAQADGSGNAVRELDVGMQAVADGDFRRPLRIMSTSSIVVTLRLFVHPDDGHGNRAVSGMSRALHEQRLTLMEQDAARGLKRVRSLFGIAEQPVEIRALAPLIFSSGASAVSRQTIGWTVAAGMTVATILAIFIVPVLFVFITRIAYGKKRLAELEANYNPDDHADMLH